MISKLFTYYRLEVVGLRDVTPLSAQKAGNLPIDWKMTIQFKTLCDCQPETSFDKRCEKCRPKVSAEEA